MKKRRRLADKMTIMVCAVLLAVSAFFYAPMELSAEETLSFVSNGYAVSDEIMTVTELDELSTDESVSFSGSAGTSDVNYRISRIYENIGTVDFSSYLGSADLYEVNCTFNYSVVLDNSALKMWAFSFFGDSSYGNCGSCRVGSGTGSINVSVTDTFYINKLDTSYDFKASGVLYQSAGVGSFSTNYTAEVVAIVNSVSEVINTDSDDYQNGYNAGYLDGENDGYGNGYSSGYLDGETLGYESGYEAGVNSVDTDSYYEAGYEAGYDVGYDEAYSVGYDAGYDDALNRIEEWGADVSEYPKLVLNTGRTTRWENWQVVNWYEYCNSTTIKQSWRRNINIDFNHTYRWDVDFTGLDCICNTEDYDTRPYWDSERYFIDIGGSQYVLSGLTDSSTTFYVPGDRMSNTFDIGLTLYGLGQIGECAFVYDTLSVKVYDCGPVGDTQNHIANQTDKLNENADKNTDKILNSWDSSKGNKVQSDLDTGLNEYQTAEDSLWVTATTGMKDFTFFDFESVPAMITGLSFVTSIMTRWFEAAGGASGVGIVLSVLFSVMLVSMVLGLYRMYQSAGHRSEVKQRRESRKKGK